MPCALGKVCNWDTVYGLMPLEMKRVRVSMRIVPLGNRKADPIHLLDENPIRGLKGGCWPR